MIPARPKTHRFAGDSPGATLGTSAAPLEGGVEELRGGFRARAISNLTVSMHLMISGGWHVHTPSPSTLTATLAVQVVR